MTEIKKKKTKKKPKKRSKRDQKKTNALIAKALSKRTPKIESDLGAALSLGSTLKQACVYAGISRSAYYVWCEKDPKLKDSMDKKRDTLLFRALNSVNKGVETDPTLALKVLKCVFKEKFCERIETKNENFNSDVTLDFGDADKKKD